MFQQFVVCLYPHLYSYINHHPLPFSMTQTTTFKILKWIISQARLARCYFHLYMEKVLLKYVPIFLFTLLLYIFLRRRYRRDPHKRHKLPPGSMGWPYVGETLQLYSQDPSVFFATKQRRFFLSLHMWFSILTFLISRLTFFLFHRVA